MRIEVPQRRAVCIASVALLWATAAGRGQAQVLAIDTLPSGTELVRVETPLADATSVAWPRSDGTVTSVSGGELTLTLGVQEALQGGDAAVETGAPPVIVAVGATGGDDLMQQLTSWLGDRIAEPVQQAPTQPLIEGAVTRRLRPAGSPSTLTLTLPLPPADTADRSDIEVLCAALPELLRDEVSQLRVSVDARSAQLQTPVDPQLAELTLRRLRLSLARLAESNALDRPVVESTRHRLMVARRARLGEHPEGATTLTELWLAGGADAVRQHLFGLESVSLDSLRAAAGAWLPLHPGHATIDLPPHAMSPRFASGPRRLELDNGAIVSLLERPGTDLATLVVRPVLLPDLTGELTATVLTRFASALREGSAVPEWIRVHPSPPWLELAAPPDRFAELVEASHAALATLWDDTTPAAADRTDPLRAAIGLLAVRLGATRSGEVIPAELLRPTNLVLGAVVTDAETAVEALDKLLDRRTGAPPALTTHAMSASSRRRIAMSGTRAAAVAAIMLPPESHWTEAEVVRALLERRAGRLLDHEFAAATPLVPGKRPVVTMVSGRGELAALEAAFQEAWPGLVAPVTDDELVAVLRQVASQITRDSSGAMGRARTAAAIAAGVRHWEPAMATQLRVLTLSAERIGELLATAQSYDMLERTGAGRLPVEGVPIPQ